MKRTTHCVALLSVFLSSCLWSSEAEARPKYQNLRYLEDWSVLRDLPTQDYLDPLKFIPFNEHGDFYLTLGGTLQTRGEGWSNFGFQDDQDAFFGLNQLRLHGDLHWKDYFRLYVEGKSSLATPRALPGGQRTIDLDTLDLQNLFVDLKWLINEQASLMLRPGRQEIDLGKERLISSLRWVNSRRNFDGVRLTGQWNDYTVDALYAQLVKVDSVGFNLSSPTVSTYGLYATGPMPGLGLKQDLYWLGLHKDKTSFASVEGSEDRQTLGTHISGKMPYDFDFDLEGAYQFGSFADQAISAFFVASEVGYKAPIWLTPRFFLGFDNASGDQNKNDQQLNTFNQYFPLAHAYYGLADVLGRQNAIDIKTGVGFSPFSDFSIKFDAHSFWRASTQDSLYSVAGTAFLADSTSASAYIGSEFDLTLKYKLDSHTTLQGGVSYFIPGDFLSGSGSSAPLTFGYLQGIYNF